MKEKTKDLVQCPGHGVKILGMPNLEVSVPNSPSPLEVGQFFVSLFPVFSSFFGKWLGETGNTLKLASLSEEQECDV